ncbi:ankyrin, partial [Lojkania enalia]
ELVDYLLPMLDDVDRHFADGFTCLTVAAMCNGTAAARKLLALGADVNKATSDRQLTPLHLAAEFSSEDTFALLLDAGADPHARSGSGTTAFYRAARGGNTHILRRLRECDCDVNACTFDNWTPLLEAVENGHEEVVDLLLEWGAD